MILTTPLCTQAQDELFLWLNGERTHSQAGNILETMVTLGLPLRLSVILLHNFLLSVFIQRRLFIRVVMCALQSPSTLYHHLCQCTFEQQHVSAVIVVGRIWGLIPDASHKNAGITFWRKTRIYHFWPEDVLSSQKWTQMWWLHELSMLAKAGQLLLECIVTCSVM